MASKRYYELDWLRVILILGVFLHHCLMPFNGDDWHIMNSQSSSILDDMMVYFEQLRLPTLFFVAGAGALLLLKKRNAIDFLKDKILRLLLPLMIGVTFIVPPQTYIENIAEHSSFLNEYPQFLINLDTNHLWFIEFLFVFMLLAIPLFLMIKKVFVESNNKRLLIFLTNRYCVLSVGALIGFFRVLLKLVYPENSHSVLNLGTSLIYLMFFTLGMIFITNKKFWESLEVTRRFNLYCLIAISCAFYGYYLIDFSPYFSLSTRWSIWWFLSAMLSWSGLVTLCGYVQRYLSYEAKYLMLCNRYIYPFYIFHQTVIVILGYWVVAMNIPISVKAIILIVLSFFTTICICRFLIAPFKPMRLLFGLRV